MAKRTRTKQVNVRLTLDEKTSWTKFAKKEGFRGLADFLRVITLRRARKALFETSQTRSS